jgi:hypothetical protein
MIHQTDACFCFLRTGRWLQGDLLFIFKGRACFQSLFPPLLIGSTKISHMALSLNANILHIKSDNATYATRMPFPETPEKSTACETLVY